MDKHCTETFVSLLPVSLSCTWTALSFITRLTWAGLGLYFASRQLMGKPKSDSGNDINGFSIHLFVRRSLFWIFMMLELGNRCSEGFYKVQQMIFWKIATKVMSSKFELDNNFKGLITYIKFVNQISYRPVIYPSTAPTTLPTTFYLLLHVLVYSNLTEIVVYWLREGQNVCVKESVGFLSDVSHSNW